MKKREYPENRHIVARMECIMNALAQARNALEGAKIGVKYAPEGPRKLLEEQIGEALDALELASQAMRGDDE